MPNRRHFIKTAAGLAFISSAPGLWSSRAIAASVDELVAAAKAAGQNKVVVDTGTGTFFDNLKELFFDPFTKQTGIEITDAAAGGGYGEKAARVRAMSEANHMELDIISFILDGVRSPTIAPYLEDLGDCSELSNVVSEGIEGACLGNSVVWEMGASILAYDASAFPNGGMKSWADFWDVKAFPGPRALPNYGTPWEVLSAALLADGVKAKEVYPLDLDRAFKKLDPLRPQITWWTSGNQSQQLLRTKEVVAAMVWNGRAAQLLKEGFPVSIVWNGAILSADAWAITKGAPHAIAAKALLNYLYTRPEAHAEFAKRMNYAMPNKHASDFMNADLRSALPTTYWSTIVKGDVTWLAENRQKIIERWTAWISG
ncbi:extracellular solute-binding protein [Mesorhizobium sp. BHbsci]